MPKGIPLDGMAEAIHMMGWLPAIHMSEVLKAPASNAGQALDAISYRGTSPRPSSPGGRQTAPPHQRNHP